MRTAADCLDPGSTGGGARCTARARRQRQRNHTGYQASSCNAAEPLYIRRSCLTRGYRVSCLTRGYRVDNQFRRD